ncbi:MAG: acetolactate synthase small subunit [Deltaproteobacteria bacterium]|nr:acetolactate synthase small subunit [Deltaproteobacteria bacterium]
MKITISALVENKPGVLTRISGLFARRAFNIDSLTAGPTENPEISRMTIVATQAAHPLEQIEKQLHKLVNVIRVTEMDPDNSVGRELMLIKVHAPPNKRIEIFDIVNTFRGKVIDVSRSTLVAEVTGDTDKLRAFQELMVNYGIVEVARTGKVALSRGR